jgi:hypothetical protein
MRRLKKITKKLFSLIMIAGLLIYGGIFNINQASARFSDSEMVENNIIGSGTLVFTVSGNDFSPPVTPTNNSFRTINFTNTGTLDFVYQAKVVNVATSSFCDSLELKDDISGVFAPLTSFISATGTFSVLSGISLTARLASSSQSLIGQTCQFDLVFTGWQTNFPDASLGFSHTQTVAAVITAGEWQDVPPPSHVVVPGDVVINELMWMGSSGDSNDEWIELRNLTDYDIDLSNWDIENGGSGSGPGSHLEIPSDHKIKANGFFLITKKQWADTAVNLTSDLAGDQGLANKASMNLLNTGEQLTLKDQDGNVIDTAWQNGVAWPAGSNGTIKQSLERNDIPSDGTIAGNWHICVDASSTVLYWDVGRTEKGTPGAPNLSEENLLLIDQFIGLNSTATATEEEATSTATTTEEMNIETATTTEAVTDEATATTTEEVNNEETATTTEEIIPPADNPPDDQPPEESVDDLLPAIANKVLDLTPITPVPDAGSGE